MKSRVSKGIIYHTDNNGIVYDICVIIHTQYEDDSFIYEFIPSYSNIELIKDTEFGGIPGLDLSIQKDIYIRKDIIPVFISERTPSKNRENLYEELQRANLEYIDPINWLINSNTKYIGDRLLVKEYYESIDLSIDTNSYNKRTVDLLKDILLKLGSLNNITIDNNKVENNKKLLFSTLYCIYERELKKNNIAQLRGINNAKSNKKYTGRIPKKISVMKLEDTFDKYNNKKITRQEAQEKLGVSQATFYRLLKKQK